MKNLKGLLSILLALALVASLFVFPASAVAEGNTISGINHLSEYQFTGENASRNGYAQGTITFDSLAGRTYYLYWADKSGIIDNFEPLAVMTASGSECSFTIERQVAIPNGVTSVAIFQGNLSTDIKNAYDLIELPASKQLTDNTVFSFASVSDIHVNYDNEGQNATGKWTAALNYFAELGLDYVILSGDMTSNATTSEFDKYKSAVEASSYDASRIYEARGNHESQNNANFLAYTSGGEAAGEIRPYENSPYFYVKFPGKEGSKDNLFIFMAQELSSTGNSANQDNWSTAQLDWVEGLLKEYSSTNTNIFLVQHTVFKGWGPGDSRKGAYSQPTYLTSNYKNNYRLKKLLQEYKEIVQMSGHTHISLYENVNFSDENGTAARMIHNSSTSQPRWFNANGGLDYYLANESYGSEGYIVNITDNDIVYYGCNFSDGKYIPAACFIMESYSEKRDDVSRIEISTPPTKAVYDAGEKFDPAGMKVTAYYKDGSSAIVKGYYVDTDTELNASDKDVTVKFGDVTTSVPITINSIFDGDGTVQSPYLIKNADDFFKFTNLVNASIASGSHDNTTFGAGKIFKQTADINMTGYPGYLGTPATGNEKCSFSGVYDGDGHTLTVNITSNSFETSVFPYLNGLLMNLNVAGSITNTSSAADGSVQLVRTIGQYGSVVNCSCSLDLTAPRARGLTLTLYGYTDRFVYDGTMNCTSSYVYPVTGNVSNGTLKASYYFAKNSAGQSITGSNGTAGTSHQTVVEAFNDSSTIAQSVSKIKSYNTAYSNESLGSWSLTDGVARVGKGSGDTPIQNDFEGEGTAQSPYLINNADDFFKLTTLFNSSISSTSHDKTTYGADKFFKQTADIDMTGYPGYLGTSATGSAKYGFSGIYDGDGHTLTVDITSDSFETSVFPYLNGLIINLNVDGSITSTSSKSDTSVQFIRTIGQNGSVINCTSSLTLKAARVRGLTLTAYGYIDRFVYNGKLDCSTSHIYPITGTISSSGVTGTIAGAYYSAINGSGSAVTNASFGSEYSDSALLTAELNGDVSATTISKLQGYYNGFDSDSLVTWSNKSMPRADGGKFIAPEPSFTTDSDEYAVNEVITFTAELPDSVTNVALVNESGRFISKTSASFEPSADMYKYNVWTITASVATRGQREISLFVYDGSSEQYTDTGLKANISIVSVKAVGNDPLIVKSVRAPEAVHTGEVFTITFKTTTSASKIGIFNANGVALGKISQSYTDKNGERIWTVSTCIGSKGSRTFSIRCGDNLDNWSTLDNSKTLNIGVVK